MDESELSYVLATADFDAKLLPPNARIPGTDEFQRAVSEFYTREYANFGGVVRVVVDAKTISVSWKPDAVCPDPLDVAVEALRSGNYAKGILLLELIRERTPDSADVLYNLGMALSDQNDLETAVRYLRRATTIAPTHINALVATGVALARQGKLQEAISVLERAIILEPRNPWAHRNLGALLLKVGETTKGEQELRKAVELDPRDQQSLYGLAEALRGNDNDQEADKYYIRAIDVDDRSPIADLAREARSRLSQKSFKSAVSGGIRPDAVMYLLGAMEKFDRMSKADLQKVAFEIAIIGQRGIDPNDPAQKYSLKSLPGKFSGLHMLCMMFEGFRRIAPEHSIGFDLSQEYEAARQLHTNKSKGSPDADTGK